MRKIKFFLASSAELDSDKEKFELFISKKNKTLHDQRIFLELVTWKDFISAMTEEHSQLKYNEYIRRCDIAIFLFHTKLGNYTKEEFDQAHFAFIASYKRNKIPLIYTYFKSGTEESEVISDFRNYIDSLNHFYDTYENLDDLLLKFSRQLDLLEQKQVILISEKIDLPRIFKYSLYFFILPLFVLFGAITSYYYFQPGQMTVKIKEVNPVTGLPFKSGTVALTYGDKSEIQELSNEVIFKQIPSKYKHNKVKLTFKSTGYEPIDTLVKVEDLCLLPIKRDNSLSLSFGRVMDENGNPLKDVTVSIKTLNVQTDEFGKFTIHIPVEEQSELIRITAYKKDYKVWDYTGSPSQEIEQKIILMK